MIFRILGIGDRDWLEALLFLPCSKWSQVSNYKKFVEFCENLTVTNDVAERGIALITGYMDRVKDEEVRQDLLLNVSHWRKAVSDLNKASLANLPV